MPSLEDRLAEVDRLKARLDALRPLDPEIEGRLLQKIRLWWTYHSNAIEGNRLTQGETEMLLLEGTTAKGKPLKDHLDLEGHAAAIQYLLAVVREREPLTEGLIRELHKILLRESCRVPAITPDGLPTEKRVVPGEYKTLPNHVQTVTGETHYYATPVETPAKMEALVRQQREALEERRVHPIEIIALFHHEFTAIHPFDDGNGRMARLLTNLLLMQQGYPPVVIRKDERDEYLQALRQADQGDPQSLIQFMADHVAETVNLYLRAAAGEEISEPSDLKKRIALLKMALEPVEEPQPLTREAQTAILEGSLNPLFREIKGSLVDFADLFLETQVRLSGTYREGKFQKNIHGNVLDFFSTKSIPLSPDLPRDQTTLIERLTIAIEFKGFKKGRFNAFDTSATVEIRFEPLKYSIKVPQTKPPLSLEHFYQEPLTSDEIRTIAEKIAGFFLDVIQTKTSISL